MNNKGQTLMMSLLFAAFIFIVGMILMNFLLPDILTARAPDALDCHNSSITDGNKVTCLMTDIAVPYWILLIISIAGGTILERLLI